jgi:hypothetical protein
MIWDHLLKATHHIVRIEKLPENKSNYVLLFSILFIIINAFVL